MARAAHKFLQLPVLNQNGRWLIRFRGKRIEFADRPSALRGDDPHLWRTAQVRNERYLLTIRREARRMGKSDARHAFNYGGQPFRIVVLISLRCHSCSPDVSLSCEGHG